MAGQGSGGNVAAAFVNVFLPGAGQLIQGRLGAAIAFFFFWAMGGYLVVFSKAPTLIVIFWTIAWLAPILDAAKYNPKER